MPEQANIDPRGPFYVGYLPLPAAVKRFLLPWLIANLVLVVAVAAVIAQQQRDPGDGVWDTSKAVTLTGVLIIDPYPLLLVPDSESPEGITTYILTQQTKAGVLPLVEQFDGRVMRMHGFLVERDGRTVFELDASALHPYETVKDWASFDQTYLPAPIGLGTHTLVGEIVDPKCYLGAMKPGEGKPHKVCATLCIAGGIPPVFVVRDETGNTTTYLLTAADGSAFPPSHHQYIADPIELTGTVERRGDLLVLRADLDSIQRLGARR